MFFFLNLSVNWQTFFFTCASPTPRSASQSYLDDWILIDLTGLGCITTATTTPELKLGRHAPNGGLQSAIIAGCCCCCRRRRAAKKRDFMSDECRFRVLHGLPDSGPMKIYELANPMRGFFDGPTSWCLPRKSVYPGRNEILSFASRQRQADVVFGI